jgi:hypothetical protein
VTFTFALSISSERVGSLRWQSLPGISNCRISGLLSDRDNYLGRTLAYGSDIHASELRRSFNQHIWDQVAQVASNLELVQVGTRVAGRVQHHPGGINS